MPDARILREITDALRVLSDRADAAGSTKARAILTMTAAALHGIAVEAERGIEMPAWGGRGRPCDGSGRDDR